MKNYCVCESPDKRKYSAVVIATGVARPLDELNDVAVDLQRRGVKGQVVFDLLTANGVRKRRYFSIDFDGKSFHSVKFTKFEGDENLRKFSTEFFTRNRDRLDLSLLTPAMRYAVRHGIPF